MIYRIAIAAAVALVGCASSPSVPSPRFYEYWQSAPDGVGAMGVPTSYYTKLFTTRGPRREFFNDTERDFYDTARGDPAALHRFFASADRDQDGAPGEGWSADMVILALIYGDTGLYEISDLAREIAKGESKTARYVKDDSKVDVAKLDVWWAGFFATGDTNYLGKILRYAKYPQPGEHAADFMIPATAAWSFKSNCQQHKAVMAFAKGCLESNKFPTKVEFLKECVSSKPHAKSNG